MSLILPRPLDFSEYAIPLESDPDPLDLLWRLNLLSEPPKSDAHPSFLSPPRSGNFILNVSMK
jgi:hypothetical protein